MIVSQYNMEAEGLGQRPAVGVTSFKKRNSEKRAGTGEPLPGQLWTTTLPLPKKVEQIPMQVDPQPIAGPSSSRGEERQQAGKSSKESEKTKAGEQTRDERERPKEGTDR